MTRKTLAELLDITPEGLGEFGVAPEDREALTISDFSKEKSETACQTVPMPTPVARSAELADAIPLGLATFSIEKVEPARPLVWQLSHLRKLKLPARQF